MTWDLFLNTPISPRFFYILYIFLHKRKRSHHTFFTLLYIFIEWHSETFLSALSPILVYESRHLYSVCVYLSNLCYLCIFIFMNLFAKTTQLSATSIAIWIHPYMIYIHHSHQNYSYHHVSSIMSKCVIKWSPLSFHK